MTKNILSLSEFERLCFDLGFSDYSFEQPLQPIRGYIDGSTQLTKYQSVSVFLSPNVIVFKNGSSILYFRHVKSLRVLSADSSDTEFEFVFTNDFCYNNCEKHLSFKARKKM